MRGLLCALAALGLLAPAPAHGGPVDEIGKDLVKLEGEVQALSQSVRRPNLKTGDTNKANRRLIEAQVSFGIGAYDEAAVMLYDYVARYPNSRSYDEALYYLAESLYLKGDLHASRTYFVKLAQDVGGKSKFFQQALERLIELSLKLRDDANVQQWLDALDAVPAAQQRASIPYVRGKYAYFSGRYDEAIGFFKQVKASSAYGFQARYFLGGTYVAKGELATALKVYSGITRMRPKSDEHKRVVELTRLAMGRVYYECNEPGECSITLSEVEKESVRKQYERAELTEAQLEEKFADVRLKKLWAKSIDEYLRISRRSDLFDEALYEIAWVYVKNKHHEKALRALELLTLANPDSARMPEVRILEGNLRIRRAQNLAFSKEGNYAEEYSKAYKTFSGTKKTFGDAHGELEKIIAERRDPRSFMAQVTGRTSDTFDVDTTMPAVAAEWLRDQPDVKRVVSVETDLGQIRDEIAIAEKTIARLEQATSSSQSVNIFPALAEKRARSVEILEGVFAMRLQLMNHERAAAMRHAGGAEKAELDRLAAARREAYNKWKELPNADVSHSERIRLARNDYDELERKAQEVALVIETTEATLVAVVKYIEDRRNQGAPAKELEGFDKPLAELRTELAELRAEHTAIKRDLTLARDRAGVGDEAAREATAVRANLRAAINAEHDYIRGMSGRVSGADRTLLDQIAGLTGRANTITDTLDKTNATIDAIVDDVLGEVRAEVSAEKAKLAAYKQEWSVYETESRELGGEVLEANFGQVKNAFYDILVRSDIGIIDISWAQREFADKTLKQLELDKKRDLRTLRIDFEQVLREEADAKEAARKKRAEDAKKGGAQ